MKEIWKAIPGYPGYEASSLGGIRSVDRVIVGGNRWGTVSNKRISGGIRATRIHNGYEMVDIHLENTKKTRLVHRLVWMAFNGAIPQGMEINHLNAKKADNKIENLEACSPLENTMHAIRLGLKKRGPSGRLLVTKEERETIKFFYVRQKGPGAFVVRSLAKIFNLAPITVSQIVAGRYDEAR